jgi:hypothetical protein
MRTSAILTTAGLLLLAVVPMAVAHQPVGATTATAPAAL